MPVLLLGGTIHMWGEGEAFRLAHAGGEGEAEHEPPHAVWILYVGGLDGVDGLARGEDGGVVRLHARRFGQVDWVGLDEALAHGKGEYLPESDAVVGEGLAAASGGERVEHEADMLRGELFEPDRSDRAGDGVAFAPVGFEHAGFDPGGDVREPAFEPVAQVGAVLAGDSSRSYSASLASKRARVSLLAFPFAFR